MSEQAQGKAVVLVVDDDAALRRQLYWLLEEKFQVLEAGEREDALAKLQHGKVDTVLCDLRMPPHPGDISEGLAIIAAARAMNPPIPVIVMTASDSRESAIEAVRRGAAGFFEKPFDEDAIIHIVSQSVYMHSLEQEVLRLRARLDVDRGFNRLTGASAALEKTLKQARTVAATTATVLISGENGTGKDMLAHAIHEESPRASAPFVAINCAALPESLIESELFGHEKGAFTGATQSRKGRFELADGGTLFLDEISELTPAVQVKLLRVLQERVFERVGGTKTVTVDIRLIAASNRDLEREVAEARFRRDLFYRLNVVPLVLPPLRERPDDIPLLAARFAVKASAKHGRDHAELDLALIAALVKYDWPGNVRELENVIERLVVLTPGVRLRAELLPEEMQRTLLEAAAPQDETTLEGATLALKRRMISAALQSEGRNKAATAKRLGISRSYLHRLIGELDIGDPESSTSGK